MTGISSVKRAVDLTLQVLDARTNRKWLRLKKDALRMQRKKCVSRAVAQREDCLIAGDGLAVRGDCA